VTATASPHAKPGPTASGWLIVGVCFVVLSVVFSARTTLSLVMPYLEGELEWSRSLVSTVNAMALVVTAMMAPFAGEIVDRFGPRFLLAGGLGLLGVGLSLTAGMDARWQFFIAFSLVAGLGFGMAANHVVSTVVSRTFSENRGLAVGIATSGSTAGQLLLVPLVASLLAVSSWRWSYLALGLACLALAPVVLRLIRRQADTAAQARARGVVEPIGVRLRFLWGSLPFHMLLWSFVICGFTTSGVIETHMMPYAVACGFPQLESATAYGVLSGFNLLGMITAGWLADRMHRPLLLGLIYAVRGLSFILLMMITDDLPMLFAFAVIFGLFDYSTVPVTASLVASHLGLRIMGLTMGLLSAGHSLGAALGSFLGGVLFDLFGRYTWVWGASIALALLAAFLCWTIRENRGQGRLVSAAEAEAAA
jgi:MFS family permease